MHSKNIIIWVLVNSWSVETPMFSVPIFPCLYMYTGSLKTMNTIFWMCSGGLSGMCIIEKVQLQTLTCFVQWSWYHSSSNVIYSVLTDSCSWDTPLHALPPLSSDSQDQGWDPHLNLFTWINQHDGLIWQSNLNSIYDGLIWQSNRTVSMRLNRGKLIFWSINTYAINVGICSQHLYMTGYQFRTYKFPRFSLKVYFTYTTLCVKTM